jgi:hypothetical protein
MVATLGYLIGVNVLSLSSATNPVYVARVRQRDRPRSLSLSSACSRGWAI